MQTMYDMTDADLLAWAKGFRDRTMAVTVGKRNGEAQAVPMGTPGRYPVHVVENVFWDYGVQRAGNDRVGGADTTTAEKVDELKALRDRWMAGDVGRQKAEAAD